MANEIIITPASPPAADADWDAVINSYTAGGKGQNELHLTNWPTGSGKPAVAAGSVIEINGGFAEFASETVIDFSGAASGTVYIYIDVTSSAGDALPIALDTAPTWSDSKGGWYYSTGNNRATGHYMTWDGSASYTQKSVMQKNNSLPVGTILMYDGAGWSDDSTMPGWYSCISTNSGYGCPDLEDQFIKGSAPADVLDTGGSSTVTLTKANIPNHYHEIDHDHGAASTGAHTHGHNSYPTPGGTRGRFYDVYLSGTNYVASGAVRSATPSVDLPAFTGNSEDGTEDGLAGTAHANEPQYYKLIFIRRCA